MAAKSLARVVAQAIHARAPLGRGGWCRRQPRLERPAGVHLHCPQRDVRQAEQSLQHLALLGHAQRAVDRSRRLRHDRQVRRSAATTDAAAAPVEQRDSNAMTPADRDDRLLRPVQVPARRETADVLRRIRVADHDFLPAADPVAIPVEREQLIEDATGVLEVARCLEQRDHAEGRRDTRFLLQQHHSEHVRPGTRHGDDVGAE